MYHNGKKVWMIEINSFEDSYRIVDGESKSHFKGTKQECEAFLKALENK